MKYKINKFKHQEANRQLLLERMAELGLTQYDIIITQEKNALMNIWDDKNSSTANITFNLTKGTLVDVDTGAEVIARWSVGEGKESEYDTDDTHVSRLITSMIEMKDELVR